MIKVSRIVTPSPAEMEFVIEGMRNAKNSWEKSDSEFWPDDLTIGENDWGLMNKLCAAGKDHRKYMRMMPLYLRITAPMYWWKEFDTYKVGTVRNSCSTMHKIADKEFELSDFSTDNLFPECVADVEKIIYELNRYRDLFMMSAGLKEQQKYWWQLIQLLPSAYNQTANVSLNYEVANNMYHARKNHKLTEWKELCKIFENLPYNNLITEVSQ